MYEEHFGLKERPFEATPDPKYLFLTPNYEEILSALLYGIYERRGLIALIGEVGTGKTLMLKVMLERLKPNIDTAYISNSDLTYKQLLIKALLGLGAISKFKDLSKAKGLQLIEDYAKSKIEGNGGVVLIVDEAQNLKSNVLENLRMLSNIETSKSKLVQIVMAGQLEFDKKIAKPELKNIAQRISLKRYSMELDELNTFEYILHRLKIADCSKKDLFTEDAMKLIWEFSNGIPRKINMLCDNSLLIGYGLGVNVINKDIIEEAIDDLSFKPSSPGTKIIKSNMKRQKDVEPIHNLHESEVGNNEPTNKKRIFKLVWMTVVLICAIIFMMVLR